MTVAATLLILLAGATVIGLRGNAALTLGLLLTTPLFFRVSGEGLALGVTVFDPQPGVTLPGTVFVAPILFAHVLAHNGFRGWSELRRQDLLLCAFAGWAALVLVLAVLLGLSPAPLVFVQAVAPIAWFVLGRQWPARNTLTPLFTGMVIGGVLTCLWMAASALIDAPDPREGGRLSDELWGGITVYQAYDYFPVLLVVCLCGAIALFVESRKVRFASAAVILAGGIIALYSRGALLAAGGAIVVLLLLWRPAVSRRALVAAAIGASLLFAGSVAVGIPATTRLVNSFSTSDDGSESNSVRLTSIRAARDIVVADPVIGRGFEPTERAPGTEIAKTLNAHNQYLDHAVRAGVPLALLFLAFVGVAMVDAWRRARSAHGQILHAAALAALSAGLISGLFQSPFIQPLTAIPLWFLLGLLATNRPDPD